METFGTFNAALDNLNSNKASNSNNMDLTTKSETESNKLLTLFEINVIRYALFIEKTQPENIDPFFLIDFMTLPESYFEPNAVEKYEKFIFRYGTHYIHSADFGGQILFENTRVVDSDTDMNEMAEKAWQETQSAFGSSASVGASAAVPNSDVNLGGGLRKDKTELDGETEKDEFYEKYTQSRERNWTNVLLQTQGGDVNIARLITRLESNTGTYTKIMIQKFIHKTNYNIFTVLQIEGPELVEWLKSIPRFPKAFKLKMRPINELINFNVRNLFVGIDALLNGTCKVADTRKCTHGSSIEEFQSNFDKRRKSLEFAIEIFRHRVKIITQALNH
jgi:deleted-in-malignant-brain-tumors protein 1